MNTVRKVNPSVFDVWCRILKRVPKSVLWLYVSEQGPMDSLRAEASQRGIDPARLIFAPRVSNDRHLERYTVADIFLDTWPYNAHTTASEALWAGCPVITLPGRAFQSRVAASLLQNVGMPQLIAGSIAEYEDRAVDLALNASKLNSLRLELVRNIKSTPLFDTPRYVRALEEAFSLAIERYRQGLPPETFHVKDVGVSVEN